MLWLTFFAFMAGFVTVLSPCVLPVLPAILSASAGQGRARPLAIVVGLILSFSFFTIALSTLVQQFGLSANVLRNCAILIIGFFGLVLILPRLSDAFAAATSFIANWGSDIQLKQKKSSVVGALLLGMALGLVWTPCAGPILAAITTLVATQKVTKDIMLLTVAYSVGAGLPLLAIAYGSNAVLTRVPFFIKHSEQIRQLFGLIMLATAVALAFNLDAAFQQRIVSYFPGIQIENNARLQQELNKLRPPPVGFPNQDFSPTVAGKQSDLYTLPILAKAPDFEGITAWINSEPLQMQTLKGKVVLVDFWTYSCINCIRTFPYLQQWYQSYKDKGFVIIGVHTPEFEFEKDKGNVEKAVERFGITYPVAMDNAYKTWQAYRNAYWPAHYLIDQNGMIRQVHFGEGGYLETENAIRALLQEAPIDKEEHVNVATPMTAETYLGYQRAEHYAPSMHVVPDQVENYTFEEPLKDDRVGLKGAWKVEAESITAENEGAVLELNFLADQVYLVLGGKSDAPIRLAVDGKPTDPTHYTKDMNAKGEILVGEPRKYDVVDMQGQGGRHRLTLFVPKGIKAYAFTFGQQDF